MKGSWALGDGVQVQAGEEEEKFGGEFLPKAAAAFLAAARPERRPAGISSQRRSFRSWQGRWRGVAVVIAV